MGKKQSERRVQASGESALDRSKFREKLLLRMLSSPATLLPFVVGVTGLLALWALNIDSGIATFGGLACILGSLGFFSSRLLVGSKSMDKKALESLEQEAMAERERALDDLDRDLREDGDPRTERSLQDLRTLAQSFREGRAWTGTLSSRSNFDILSGVDRLFKRCVASLEDSLKLWRTAESVTTEDARKPILEQRERIIEEVEKSLRHLGRIVAGVQGLGQHTGSDVSGLANIRKELDTSLEVARRVEVRMQSLDQELHLKEPGE